MSKKVFNSNPEFIQTTTPWTVGAGRTQMYFKANNKLYQKHWTIESEIWWTSIVTVWTGGNYATFKDFAENISWDFYGILISDITETGDTLMNASRELINPSGYTVDFNAYHILTSSAVNTLTFDNIKIAYRNNGGLFDNLVYQNGRWNVIFKGYTYINNTSTYGTGYGNENSVFKINTVYSIYFDYVYMNVPNYDHCGFAPSIAFFLSSSRRFISALPKSSSSPESSYSASVFPARSFSINSETLTVLSCSLWSFCS